VRRELEERKTSPCIVIRVGIFSMWNERTETKALEHLVKDDDDEQRGELIRWRQGESQPNDDL
jgi:hypothetical protein